MLNPTDAEGVVQQRYGQAAATREPQLCCPIDYDPQYLEPIPDEVIERDYGCGDPSRYLNPGETVLDLGSGTGKICFIASQVVGEEGRVIGVDMTSEMLDVARRAAPEVAERVGWSNVEFRRGRIQDLELDLDLLDDELQKNPVDSAAGFVALDGLTERLRAESPMIESESVDVVVSNCVLNLVATEEKDRLFREICRVLRRGGRAVISDIVSDEPVSGEMAQDPELWSGCISGAYTEYGFLRAFEDAGFYGIRVVERQDDPWQTVEGIEFRSVTVEAFKGKEGPCLERNQAVIYRGPFKEVVDDDGHRMERGRRYAVCDKTYRIYQREPYRDSFDFVEPRVEIPLEEAGAFDCSRTPLRHPKETKGEDYDATTESSECCTPASGAGGEEPCC